MKIKVLIFNAFFLASPVLGHESHPEGYHGSQGVFSQVDPVLVGSLAMTFTGVLALAVSYRKYVSS